MGRKNRTEIEYGGAIYHIIVKGIDGINIFTNDIDRNKFLFFLHNMVKEYKIHLFAYVLMNTHTHLLLKTEMANLSKAMQFLNSSYAHWYNYKHVRKGHLFQDRYTSYLILNSQYLLSASSYISLNPVEAGMVGVSEPEKYRWGSFHYFNSQKDVPSWLNISEFLQLCELKPDAFVDFVKKHSFEKKKNIQALLDQLSTDNQTALPKDINNLLNKVNKYFGDINSNKSLRNLLIFVLIKEGYKIHEIADLFQMSRQAVSKIINKIGGSLASEPLYLLWLNNIKICLSL